MNFSDFSSKRIHFSGIGGISMNGLAMILHAWGYRVTGSDKTDSPLIAHLRELGIPVAIGTAGENVEGADLLVRTSAIKNDHPEFLRAQELGIPVMERGTLLGQIMQHYKEVFCVCGSHGKTTASSMLAYILERAQKDPTIHLGGVLPLIDSATKMGGTDYFVAEADEYTNSFLRFFPTFAVLLNIDLDHLDFFKDIDDVEHSFARFVSLLPKSGHALGNGDDGRVRRVLASAPCPAETFGFADDLDWQAREIAGEDGRYAFSLFHHGEKLCRVKLAIFGRHHIMNATAALAAASYAGVEPSLAAAFLADYQGAHRRFEDMGSCAGAEVYHDYAHHPTEVRATITAAREMTKGRLLCVFQPHTYSRTHTLFDAFTQAFDHADQVVLVDIYAAREKDTGLVHSRDLARAIQDRGQAKAVYAASFREAADWVRAWARPGDVILTMGAGDIEQINPMLVE